MLGAVVVHPKQREVFVLAPEPIVKGDGATKNDCERTAAKRLLSDVRREHPPLKLIVVEDSLASNGPHIEGLKRLGLRFILGAKRGDHAFLYDWVDATPGVETVEVTDEAGVRHWFRDLNGVPLNDAHFELEVNFLEYWERRPNGKEQHFAWVTDLPIQESTVMELMRAGWGAVAHRERDIQSPEEPRLQLRAQFRSRREATVDGVCVSDDAGLFD